MAGRFKVIGKAHLHIEYYGWVGTAVDSVRGYVKLRFDDGIDKWLPRRQVRRVSR